MTISMGTHVPVKEPSTASIPEAAGIILTRCWRALTDKPAPLAAFETRESVSLLLDNYQATRASIKLKRPAVLSVKRL